MTGANITEIFHSFQGEGFLAGKPFLFVRFGGCNLKCTYCDTKWSARTKKKCRVTTEKEKIELVNPITTAQFSEIIKLYKFSFISFTGGEPMLYSDFIEETLPLLSGKQVLIETNGTLYEKLTEKLINTVNYWSVDIKLFSTSGLLTDKSHRKFLEKLSDGKNILIKCIFSPKSKKSELLSAYKLALEIRRKNINTFLTFQPVTLKNKIRPGKNMEIIKSLSEDGLIEVRLIPQMHRLLNIK